MAGERALVSSAGGQGLPGTSRANLDMGSVTYDPDNILTESSAGVYRPDEEGYYYIYCSGEFESTHDNRQNIKWIGSRNGTDVSGFLGSNYSRHNEADIMIIQAWAILPFNGTTDTFEIDDLRDSGGGTPAGNYNWTYIKVIRLTDSTTGVPYARYGTPTAGAFSGADSYTDVAGFDVESETDDTVIELQAGGTNIRLKEADRPYLAVYAMDNSDSGAGRTTRLSRALHNSTVIAHSYGYAYQRNSADQYAIPNGNVLVRPGTANQDLKFQIAGYEDVGGVFWGVFDVGSWTLASGANRTGVMIIALPADTNIAIFEDLTAGQNTQDAGPDTINHSRSAVGTVDSPFSRINNTDVDVTSAVDVLAFGSLAMERITSSGERGSHGVRWEIEGVDDATSAGYSYGRGDQSSDDCKNCVSLCVYVGSPSANDTFQMERYRIGASENGTNTDSMYAGSFFIDLDSLAAPAPDTDLTVHVDSLADEADVTITSGDIDAFDDGWTNGTNTVKADDSVTIDYGSFTSRSKTVRYVSDGSGNTAAREWDTKLGIMTELGYLGVWHFDQLPSSGNAVFLQFADSGAAINFELRIASDGSINFRDAAFVERDTTAASLISAGDTIWISMHIKAGEAGSSDLTLEIYDDAGTLLDTLVENASTDFNANFEQFRIGMVSNPTANRTWRHGQQWIYENDTTPPAMPTFDVDVTPTSVSSIVAIPGPTIMVAPTVLPNTIGTSIAAPLPTAEGAATMTPSVAPLTMLAPLPTAKGGSSKQPAVVPLVADAPTPSILAASTVTPSAVPLVLDVPAPTAQAASSVSPSVIAAILGAPLPSLTIAPTATPSVVPLVLDAPTPTASGGSAATPTAIPLVLSAPAPSLTIAPTVLPSAIPLVADLPLPIAGAGAGVAPATVALVAASPLSVVQGSTTIAKINLSDPTSTPLVDTDHKMHVRARSATGTGTRKLKVELYQGASTLIESYEITLGTSYATDVHTFSSANIANITDYDDLRVWLTGIGDAGSTFDVAWVQFELPEGATDVTVLPAAIALSISLPTPTIEVAPTVTPAAIATVLDVPTPVAAAASTVEPSTVPIVINAPTPTASGGSAATPAVVPLVMNAPLPTAQAASLVTPSVVPLILDTPTPTILAEASVSPAAVASALGVPQPTILAGASVLPGVIGTVIAMPQPGILSGAEVTPSVVPLVAGLPTPTIVTAGAVTPSVIPLVAAMPGASISAASDVTPNVVPLVMSLQTPSVTLGKQVYPASIPLNLDLPAVTVSAGAEVNTGILSLIGSLPQPTISAGATVSPGVIPMTLSLPPPAALAASTVAPAVLPLLINVPQPLINAEALVTPAAVPLVMALPTASPVSGASRTPSTIPLVLAAPLPQAQAESTVTPSVVDLVMNAPTPSIALSANVQPTAIATVISVPTPSVLAEALVAPSTIATVVALPTPSVATGGAVIPATIPLVAGLPTPSLTVSPVATPASVDLTLQAPQPTYSAGSTVTPASFELVLEAPTPSVATGGTATPATIDMVMTAPTPGIGISAEVQPSTIGMLLDVLQSSLTIAPTVTPATIPLVTVIHTPTISVVLVGIPNILNPKFSLSSDGRTKFSIVAIPTDFEVTGLRTAFQITSIPTDFEPTTEGKTKLELT